MASSYSKLIKQGDLFAGLDPSVAMGLLPQSKTNMVEFTPTMGFAMPAKGPQMPPVKSVSIKQDIPIQRPKEDLEAQIEANLQSGMNTRIKDIGKYDNMVNELSAQKDDLGNLDLSGLASLADAWGDGKSNYAGSYRRPENAQDRKAKIAQIEELKRKEMGALSDDQINYLKAKMDNRERLAMAAQLGGRQERFNESQDLKMFDKARKEQAGLVKDAADFNQSSANVEDAITPDASGSVSVGRVHQALSQFSRLMGEKGVLTDTDIGRQLSPTIDLMLAKYGSMLVSDPNARVDASQVAAMKDALVTAKKAFAQRYQQQADIFKNTYFENEGSPYRNKPWADTLIQETYKPLEKFQTPQGANQPATDHANAALAELKRRGL